MQISLVYGCLMDIKEESDVAYDHNDNDDVGDCDVIA